VGDRGGSQVIEVAAGLSARGWRFAQRYGDRLTYIEADLPDMAARKRQLLVRVGTDLPGHRVADIDALSDDGPQSIGALGATLDPAQGLAIVTEGLVNYFDRDPVTGMWARFARVLQPFAHGVYLSDLHLSGKNADFMTRAFTHALSAFVRGRVHLHFGDSAEALNALRAAGFSRADLHNPAEFAGRIEDCDRPGAGRVRIIEASTGAAQGVSTTT
jgi:O-methyltransferase involved in polyketide biosynthesis